MKMRIVSGRGEEKGNLRLPFSSLYDYHSHANSTTRRKQAFGGEQI